MCLLCSPVLPAEVGRRRRHQADHHGTEATVETRQTLADGDLKARASPELCCSYDVSRKQACLRGDLRKLARLKGTAMSWKPEAFTHALIGAHRFEGAEGAGVDGPGATADRALHLQPRLDGVRRICAQPRGR